MHASYFLHKYYLKKHRDRTDTAIRLICDKCRNKFLQKKDLKKNSDTTHTVIGVKTYL